MSSTDTNDPLLSLPYRTNEPSITLKYPLNSYELKNAGELRKTLEDTYQVSYVPSKADVGRMIIEGSVLDEKERQEILATAYNTLVQYGICPIGQASELIWLKLSEDDVEQMLPMDDKAKLQYINKRSVKGNVREDYYLSGTSRAHDKVAIPYHRPSPRDDAPQSTHVERFLDSWHRRHGSNSCWSDTC